MLYLQCDQSGLTPLPHSTDPALRRWSLRTFTALVHMNGLLSRQARQVLRILFDEAL